MFENDSTAMFREYEPGKCRLTLEQVAIDEYMQDIKKKKKKKKK